MSAGLRLERVACVRGGRLLFEGLDLALGPGQAAVLTGPNGVGKSSLLRIAAGLLAPAAGRVAPSGAVAFADGNAALDRALPLVRALGFWARVDGVTPRDVDRALVTMDLAALADVPVRMLSTGQARRAGIARVIAGGADVWLLDEPANGLDERSLGRLAAAMAVHRANGGVILAASHQPLRLEDARVVTLDRAS